MLTKNDISAKINSNFILMFNLNHLIMRGYYFKLFATVLLILSVILAPFAQGKASSCAVLLIIMLLFLRITLSFYFSDKANYQSEKSGGCGSLRFSNVMDKEEYFEQKERRLAQCENDLTSSRYGIILCGIFSLLLIFIIDWGKVFSNMIACLSDMWQKFPLFGL